VDYFSKGSASIPLREVDLIMSSKKVVSKWNNLLLFEPPEVDAIANFDRTGFPSGNSSP
jgi:hypothetical protein